MMVRAMQRKLFEQLTDTREAMQSQAEALRNLRESLGPKGCSEMALGCVSDLSFRRFTHTISI